jgi:hypothetical protein
MSPLGAMPAMPCSPWMRTHSSWGWGGAAEGGAGRGRSGRRWQGRVHGGASVRASGCEERDEQIGFRVYKSPIFFAGEANFLEQTVGS